MDEERERRASREAEINEAAGAWRGAGGLQLKLQGYGFGAGTVDALNAGGAFLSFASGPRRYLKGASRT